MSQTGDNRGTTPGNFTYVLNRANRIAEARRGGVLQGTYLYDGFERLRSRVVSNQVATANNGTTHYVWDIFGNIIAEADGTTGTTLRETAYLEGLPLAAFNRQVTPVATYAIHVGHLNRPIMLTDAAKANIWWARYEPFGRVHATGGTITQNLGLPGQWFQLENGLAYNWHRHYDPTTGRYTTADPLGFVDGPSVFAYAGNNPQRMVDPSGLDTPAMGPYGGCWWGVCVPPAAPFVGTPNYSYWSPHREAQGRFSPWIGGRQSNKCNLFVWDMLNAVGLPPGRKSGGRPPSAAEWADPMTRIVGYEPLPAGAFPGIGDVVAAGGHVGIFSPDQKTGAPATISATSAGVINNSWGFRPNSATPTIWRPTR